VKLYQLCIANEGLISDQSPAAIVEDYLDPNMPYESLKTAMRAANEEMQYMDEELEIASWRKTENGGRTRWDNEVDGVQYRIWEIGLIYEHNIIELAKDAIPEHEDEWGSERQVDAQNLFCDQALRRMTPDEKENWEIYAYKASVYDMVVEALKALGEEIPEGIVPKE